MNGSKPREAAKALLLEPKLDGIAAELKDRKRWVAWKLVEREGKPTMMPIAPLAGQAASSTDAATWGTFDEAVTCFNERQAELDSLVAELFPKANPPTEPAGSTFSDREVALSALNALNAERADQYSDWLAVGMGLHAVDSSLLSEWEAWSRSSAKYRVGDCAAKWRSFNGRGLGLGSLIHWARDDSPGWQPRRGSTSTTENNGSENSTTRLTSIPLHKLLADYAELQPPVIHGLLRLGETANIIAAPKAGKSWLATDLVLSVATGLPWLDSFATVTGPVLLIDNELHPATLANRLRMVAEARGIPLANVAECVQVDSAPWTPTRSLGIGARPPRHPHRAGSAPTNSLI